MFIVIAHTQSLVFFVTFILLTMYGLYRTHILGKIPFIRKLAPFEAMEEGIGSALERGKKVQFAIPSGITGGGGSGGGTSTTLISLSMLGFFAKKAAEAGVPAVYSCSTAPTLVLMDGVIRDAYSLAGKPEDFDNPDKVQLRMIGTGQPGGGGVGGETAFVLAYTGLLQRENVGTTVFSGSSGKNLLLIGEAGREAGAFQININPTSSKLSWAVATFDYVLMMSEPYVAGAMLTKDKTHLGSVIGTDLGTWLMVALIVIFTAIATVLGTSLKSILVG